MNENKLQILNKNNLLIKSNYDLNLVQNRFYLTILYNMQKQDTDYICTIQGKELKKLVQNKTQNRNKGIYNILESLRKKSIELQEIKDEYMKLYNCGIISSFEWNEKTDTYLIKLDGKIYDLLINYYELSKGYTPLNLGVLIGFNNYYAQRFYELIRMESWKGKRINFDINYLRKTFEIGNKYKQYTDFRKRIINPSVEVLNNTGKFNISYEEIKQGRKVISIDFVVEDLEPREYFNILENEKVEIKKVELIQPVEKIKKEYFENINSVVKENTEDIEQIIDVSMLEKGFLLNFKKAFKNIDFNIDYIQDAYYQVVGIIIERDNINSLGMRQWKLFKKIFMEVTEKNEQEDIENFLWELEQHYIEKNL